MINLSKLGKDMINSRTDKFPVVTLVPADASVGEHLDWTTYTPTHFSVNVDTHGTDVLRLSPSGIDVVALGLSGLRSTLNTLHDKERSNQTETILAVLPDEVLHGRSLHDRVTPDGISMTLDPELAAEQARLIAILADTGASSVVRTEQLAGHLYGAPIERMQRIKVAGNEIGHLLPEVIPVSERQPHNVIAIADPSLGGIRFSRMLPGGYTGDTHVPPVQ